MIKKSKFYGNCSMLEEKKESLQMLLHGSRQGIDLTDPDGPL